LYALALVPTVVAALVVSGWVMDVSKHQAPGLPSDAGEWALNILPAFATGLLIFLIVARFVRICVRGRGERGSGSENAERFLSGGAAGRRRDVARR